MAERLIERKDGTLDLVNHSEMNIGDEFNHSYNSIDKKQIYGVITEIIEQRKERGIYSDETNRRFWAKVRFNKIQKQ